MLDPKQANARRRMRSVAAAVPTRTFTPPAAPFRVRAVGRRLKWAIRRPVLACLLWRMAAFRARHRSVHADACIK